MLSVTCFEFVGMKNRACNHIYIYISCLRFFSLWNKWITQLLGGMKELLHYLGLQVQQTQSILTLNFSGCLQLGKQGFIIWGRTWEELASTFLSELDMCYLEYYYSSMQEFETYVELTQWEHNLPSHSGNHSQQKNACAFKIVSNNSSGSFTK